MTFAVTTARTSALSSDFEKTAFFRHEEKKASFSRAIDLFTFVFSIFLFYGLSVFGFSSGLFLLLFVKGD